jgi:CO/xanthine dehydrogenase Mo-binding subunit
MAYKSVNKSVPRIEGAEKVSGKMRYAADLDFPNALAAKILRTSLPHAKILGIDTSKALKLRGVRAVITGADVGSVMVGLRMKDMPLLATDRVRYAGEPVAAVAADTGEIAEEALNLIDVQYQELPYVTDPVEATRPGAPVLHDNPAAYKNAPEREIDLPNVQSYGKWSNGDLAAGFKKAARVFEHTFRTPLGFHGYIEPHACTVEIHDDGRVEIWASNKAPFTLRARFARDLGLDEAKVKVHILPVGGDFGGKTSVVEAPVCYFLAQKTKKPVRMVLQYTEELTAISHRHPAVITLRTAVDADKKITAMTVRALFSGGGYAALKANAEVTVQGPRRAASYYRIPAIQVETLCAYTNQVPCTQTRTPGSPQTTLASWASIRWSSA